VRIASWSLIYQLGTTTLMPKSPGKLVLVSLVTHQTMMKISSNSYLCSSRLDCFVLKHLKLIGRIVAKKYPIGWPRGSHDRKIAATSPSQVFDVPQELSRHTWLPEPHLLWNHDTAWASRLIIEDISYL
jgi:hypothetical protein